MLTQLEPERIAELHLTWRSDDLHAAYFAAKELELHGLIPLCSALNAQIRMYNSLNRNS